MIRKGFLLLAFLLALTLTTTALAQITFTKQLYSPPSHLLAVGDFDRDGRPDIASIHFTTTAIITVYRGVSGGLRKTAQYATSLSPDAIGIYAADVNNDGSLDLVICKQYTPELEIWYGNGDATFKFGQVLKTDHPALWLGIADVNKDGFIDIVTGERDDARSGSEVLVNNGSGTFTRKSFVAAPQVLINFAFADFNRDGRPDILFRTSYELALFTGNVDGTFDAGPVRPFFPGQVGTMVVGNFNRDTALDIAYRFPRCWTCPSGTVYVFLNDGAGNFSLKSTMYIGLTDMTIEQMGAGDLNNDGVMDLVMANTGGTTSALDNAVVYLPSKGDGTFGPQVRVASLPSPGFIAGTPTLRHFSRDSQMDILQPSGSLMLLFANNAPTNCTPPSTAKLATRICTPAANSTVSTRFTVKAAGDSPAGVARMDLWIDGKKVYELWGDQLKRTVTVTAGTHRIVVQSFDKYIGSAKQVIYVTAK